MQLIKSNKIKCSLLCAQGSYSQFYACVFAKQTLSTLQGFIMLMSSVSLYEFVKGLQL